MKKTLSISLIILGSFLEIYYYVWKYTSEGEDWRLAVAKGAALTILTIGLALLLRKHWGFWILIALSISYSIFCTSSGQATSYAHRYNADASAVISQQQDYERAEEERQRLTNSLDSLIEQKRLKEQARDDIPISSRTYWQFVGFDSEGDARYQKAESEVFSTLNSEIEAYDRQIRDTQNRLDNLEEPPPVIHEKETDSYAILHDMTGLPEIAWQYILQSMFSLFAAIMAPIGISMLRKEKKPEPEPKKEPRDDMDPFIRYWVRWSWYWVRNNRGPGILPKEAFMKHAKKNYPEFTDEMYERIKKAAFEAGAIDKERNVCYNDEDKALKNILEVCNAERNGPQVCGKERRGRQA